MQYLHQIAQICSNSPLAMANFGSRDVKLRMAVLVRNFVMSRFAIAISEMPKSFPHKQTRVVTEEVVRSFNTWAFKREQPSDLNLLHKTVGQAVAQSRPVPFVLYWGKGPRSVVGTPEEQCLDYIATLGLKIRAVYAPGAHITLLLTDTHAELNSYSDLEIDTYFQSMQAAATQRGFDCQLLSKIVRSTQPVTATYIAEQLDEDLLGRLTRSATKWYRGDEAPARAAELYFSLNMIERRAVGELYADAIFVTFNSSHFRLLFPDDLPIFYMYSIKKGIAVKPWFTEVE
jgi:L-tyrosine isonitrile synthase